MVLEITMDDPNVFGGLFAPTETDYDEKVREIILALQKRTVPQRHTQRYLAQRIGVTSATIHNAQEMHNSLSGWVIFRILFEFGEDAIAPLLGLGGVSSAPDDGKYAAALERIGEIVGEVGVGREAVVDIGRRAG